MMNPADKQSGWTKRLELGLLKNVQPPLLLELTDTAHTPALLAPPAKLTINADAPDVALSPRIAGGFLY